MWTEAEICRPLLLTIKCKRQTSYFRNGCVVENLRRLLWLSLTGLATKLSWKKCCKPHQVLEHLKLELWSTSRAGSGLQFLGLPSAFWGFAWERPDHSSYRAGSNWFTLACTPRRKLSPSVASCCGESASLRQMAQSLAMAGMSASKDSMVTQPS